jgi:hypothetical protein
VSEQIISSNKLAQTPLIKTAILGLSLIALVISFIVVVSRRATSSQNQTDGQNAF